MDQSYAALAGRRVLVIEDEILVSLALEQLLTDAGCVVLASSTVSTALEMVKAHSFDAALLDINLNGERVFPVAYALLDRGVPFIFLSAYDRSVLPPGLVTFPLLRKPFDNGEVLD